jgi:hypothetical protein
MNDRTKDECLGLDRDELRAEIEARDRQIEDRDQSLQSMGAKLERLRVLVRAIHDETRDNARHFSSDSYLPIHLRQRIEAALDE